MKKAIFLLFLLIYIKSYSQTEKPVDSLPKRAVIQTQYQKEEDDISDKIVFTKAEKSPTFPGGASAWSEFLAKEINANAPVFSGAPVGKYIVVIRFVVSKDGTLRDFSAETRHGFGMEEEAIRVLMKSTLWIPAEQNGRKVNFFMRQPITFVVGTK